MCALFKSIFIFRQFLALIRIQSKNEMFSKTKQTIINNTVNERLKKQRKKDEHTLKQSEIPVMQI
jgi:CRISPR/Cas system-associated endonuclease Cas1